MQKIRSIESLNLSWMGVWVRQYLCFCKKMLPFYCCCIFTSHETWKQKCVSVSLPSAFSWWRGHGPNEKTCLWRKHRTSVAFMWNAGEVKRSTQHALEMSCSRLRFWYCGWTFWQILPTEWSKLLLQTICKVTHSCCNSMLKGRHLRPNKANCLFLVTCWKKKVDR